MSFLEEWLVVLGTVVGLSFAGGWALVPLRERGPQLLYAAPALGLAVVVAGVGTLYPTLHLTLGQSVAVVSVVSATMTIAAVWHARKQIRWRAIVAPVLLAVILGSVVTRIMCDTTWRSGSPGLLYFDGTDHLGYAQMADWLTSHTILAPPRADPSLPYESFPEVLFRVDTRFGSFEWMGITSMLTKQPGSFAYDVASAIVITVSILALAGLFSRSPWMAALLAFGLLTSHWFDFASTGFFGKVMGFPTSMFVAGLYVTASGAGRLSEVAVIALVAAAGAIMYSGLVTAFLILTIGLTFAVFEMLRVKRATGSFSSVSKDRFVLLGLLAGVATLTTGFASRPATFGYPDFNVDWAYIIPRVMDLENQGVALSGLDPVQVVGLGVVFVVTVIVGLVIAVVRGLSVPVALIAGPSILLGSLFLLNARAMAFQLIGVAYPLTLCGLAVLVESASPRPTFKTLRDAITVWIAGLLFVVLAVSHVPRFVGSVERYAGPNAPDLVRFNVAEMDTLSSLIGTSTVEVDITQPQTAIMAMVEFGRRGVVLQWSPRGWATILGYRAWPAPSYATPATLCLSSPEAVDVSALYWSPRYRLTTGACVSQDPAKGGA